MKTRLLDFNIAVQVYNMVLCFPSLIQAWVLLQGKIIGLSENLWKLKSPRVNETQPLFVEVNL